MRCTRSIITLSLVFFGLGASAAETVQKYTAPEAKGSSTNGPAVGSAAAAPAGKSELNSFFSKGSISGGQAHAGQKAVFSILRLQKLNNPSTGIERLILTFGDQDGLPLSTPPGYFHVAVDQGGKRVILDLAQVQKTTVDQNDFTHVLKDSGYIASSIITMDPVDLSTNIILQMKKPVKVRASLDKDERKINQLVLDFDKL